MAVQGTHDSLNIKGRKAHTFKHCWKSVFCAEPGTFVSISSSGRIVAGQLFCENLNQGFFLRVAIAAEGKKKCLGKIVQDHSLTLRAFLRSFNEGQC